MVLAGPGSGKTTVITHRVRHLIEQRGVAPEKILVITFTKAAALEMRDRFINLCGGLHHGNAGDVSFGTFHAVFFSILRDAFHYTAQDILREDEHFRILQQQAERYSLEREDMRELIRDISGEISLVKNEQIPLDHFYSSVCSDEVFREIYKGYHHQLHAMKKLDYDDMLTGTLKLLQTREEILSRYRERFHFFLIDEFQDINRLQEQIIRLLAAPDDHLFIVGDDDQSIYRFRGAQPRLMLSFPKTFPGAAILRLEENYRSRPQITRAAGKVIALNKERFPKQIRAMRPPGGKDTLQMAAFDDVSEEALYLVREIRKRAGEGTKLSQIAVLTRTGRMNRYIAAKLLEYEIPAQVTGQIPSLYDHWVAKDIFTYLRLGLGSRRRSDLLQVMNRPLRYLSRDCLDAPVFSFDRLRSHYKGRTWMAERLDQLEEALMRISRMTPYAAVNYIRFGIGYDRFLEEYASAHSLDVQELIDVAGEIQERSKAFSSFRDWSDHIDRDRERSRKEQERRRKGIDAPEERTEAVRIMTLHGAKGLEFDTVFLPDLNEGILPYHRAGTGADIEEERRLFYVGMTRTKEHLYLTWTRYRFGKEMRPSRFLAPLIRT